MDSTVLVGASLILLRFGDPEFYVTHIHILVLSGIAGNLPVKRRKASDVHMTMKILAKVTDISRKRSHGLRVLSSFIFRSTSSSYCIVLKIP